MNARKQSVYLTSSVLFQNESNPILAYCLDTMDFQSMLAILHRKEMFLANQSNGYTMKEYLKQYFPADHRSLSLSPAQLLAQTLPLAVQKEKEALPEMFGTLSREIDCYREMIGAVLNNQLAERPYENLCDQENVTEKEHALQAGKMALLMGMTPSDVLALLLHDIARPSVNDALHGHANHCEEGRAILAPLGLTVDYSGYHALAKYLLYTFCPRYKGLISAVSEYTLTIQEKKLSQQGIELNHLDAQQLPLFLSQIMFMRLIDDMSKVPEYELKPWLGEKKADYFTDDRIQKMLDDQLIMHLKALSQTSVNEEETVERLRSKLHTAMLLMLRSREYYHQSDLCEKYKDICDPLIAELVLAETFQARMVK